MMNRIDRGWAPAAAICCALAIGGAGACGGDASGATGATGDDGNPSGTGGAPAGSGAAAGGEAGTPEGGSGGGSPGNGGAGSEEEWYLSDLCDTGDATNAWGPVERDRSNGEQAADDGGPIILQGRVYGKGLGMHAPASIGYALGGQCSRFQAVVGIDAEMKNAGSIVFEVWGDGDLLLATETLTGASPAESIDLDVSGVRELRLVLNEDGGNGSDHGDWADARVTCSARPAELCPRMDPPIPTVPGYELVWSDEFDGDGPPDPANWSFERGFVRNEELQWYQEDNAWQQAGFLIIEGRRETLDFSDVDRSGWRDWAQNRTVAEYTSSSLHTRGKQSWQYGRIEMRGRIVAAEGLWPAFWTLGNEGEWPSNGEIDIMEFYKGRIHANFAVGTETRWQARWDSWNREVSSFEGTDWDAKFHVWRLDWDADSACIFIDGEQVNCTDVDDMRNADDSAPFRQPHYVLLNLAIGGTGGGAVSGGTRFPTHYVIDYVRVYQ